MKKYLLLSIITLFFFKLSSAQNHLYEYGIHGGINISSAFGNDINEDYKSTLQGICIGGHFKINTSKHFGIKASLEYSQQGWSYRSLTLEDITGTTIGKGDILFKLNYLNLPILTEYSFGNKIQFKANAGMFFGMLLSNQIVTKLKEPLLANTVSITKSSSLYKKSTNFGISFGAGLQIPMAKKLKLDLDLRNNYGLSNIEKRESKLSINTFSILLGMTYTL